MTRTRGALAVVVVLALLASVGGTVLAPALGAPSALTLSKAKKLFLTKKKAKRTYVTKKQAAAFVTRGSGDQRYVTRSGETRVPIDPRGWHVADGTGNILVAVQSTNTVLQNQGVPVNDVDFFASTPLPTMLGGRPLSVVGLELCYSFTQTAGVEPAIDHIALQRAARTGASTTPMGLTNLFLDDIGRIDDACTTLRFPPVQLLPSDVVGVGLRVDYASANTQMRVGAGSLILAS